MAAWMANLTLPFNGNVYAKYVESLQSPTPASTGHQTIYNLHKMTDKGLNYDGAVCLDGSDAAFYYHAGTGDGVNKWIFYFNGGGWCSTLGLLGPRARYFVVGTSNNILPTFTVSDGGQMSANCNTNPTFCNYNKVFAWYCDGFSFAGDKEQPDAALASSDPAKYTNTGVTQIYYRGRRNLKAILDTLARDHNLNATTDFLLTGGSAGGIATFFAADWAHDYVKGLAPGLVKFKAMPTSGYFISDPTLAGVDRFATQCFSAMWLHNGWAGVDASCLEHEPYSWECGCTDITYHYIDTPIFVHNAAVDSYALYQHHVYESPDTSWFTSCVTGFAGDLDSCTDAQTVALNKYMDRTMALMRRSPMYTKPGNGAMMHSCYYLHVEAFSVSYWDVIAMDNLAGTHVSTMHGAALRWWNSDGAEPYTSTRTSRATGSRLARLHLQPDLHRAAAPRRCRPRPPHRIRTRRCRLGRKCAADSESIGRRRNVHRQHGADRRHHRRVSCGARACRRGRVVRVPPRRARADVCGGKKVLQGPRQCVRLPGHDQAAAKRRPPASGFASRMNRRMEVVNLYTHTHTHTNRLPP